MVAKTSIAETQREALRVSHVVLRAQAHGMLDITGKSGDLLLAEAAGHWPQVRQHTSVKAEQGSKWQAV